MNPLLMWWKEIVATIVLLAAAVATFATLYMHQNQPQLDWPYSITIGALLSICSVFLRLAAGF